MEHQEARHKQFGGVTLTLERKKIDKRDCQGLNNLLSVILTTAKHTVMESKFYVHIYSEGLKLDYDAGE